MAANPPSISIRLRKERRLGRQDRMITLAGWVSVWYAGSVVANASSKRILLVVAEPLLLTGAQFAISVLACRAVFVAQRRQPPPLQHAQQRALVRRIAAVYTLGFAMVNVGYVLVTVSLAETLRAMEPVFAAVLTLLFLKEERVSRASRLSLVPIVVGASMSCHADGSFGDGALAHRVAVIACVAVSNFCFAARSIATKRLKRIPAAEAPRLDTAALFYHISRVGLALLVAAVLTFYTMRIVYTTAASLPSGAQQRPSSIFAGGAAVGGVSKLGGVDVRSLAVTVLLNGVSYFVYNIVSFVVLDRVHVVTHAVANAVRRVVTIFASVLYFRNVVTSFNTLGVMLALFGVCAYTWSGGVDRGAGQCGAGGGRLPRESSKPA